MNAGTRAWLALAALLALGALGVLLGLALGASGWSPWTGADALAIIWQIRLPRSLGAWCAGALLGLGGAIAQGLFRNPLADPYLLGSASGAALGVAIALAFAGGPEAALGLAARAGLTGAAFIGALLAVLATLALARGVQHTLRLLLAGVIVGVVLAAAKELVVLAAPDVLRSMQAFLLGTTGLLGWDSVALLALVLLPCLLAAAAGARVLDALVLGGDTARSLGVPVQGMRIVLVAAMALATAAAVAQAGLIAFVGLAAPHIVRQAFRPTHGALLPLSAAAGGALLLAADLVARSVIAPRELPVGVITALVGGTYLLWLMLRRQGLR
jgi:iron complex transport system permease protein